METDKDIQTRELTLLQAELVFLPSPNNPTGNVLSLAEIEAILQVRVCVFVLRSVSQRVSTPYRSAKGALHLRGGRGVH